jgi:CRISPR-associated protein Cas1
VDFEVAWFSPQSEYRPTEYLQSWVRFWFDEERRLKAAKQIQSKRLELIRKSWLTNRALRDAEFNVNERKLVSLLASSAQAVEETNDNPSLLTQEARLTKDLYKLAVDTTAYGSFKRAKKGTGSDSANNFLDHGNYLAYGLGATATWVLGLPHGLAVLHGKTRRGGLVFDVADLIKDAFVLPLAFVSASRGDEPQQFRDACVDMLTRYEALDIMIETLKSIAVPQENTFR